MNRQDRKQLEEIRGKLEEAKAELEMLAGDLEDKTGNVEEYFEGTVKAETMREETDKVNEIYDELETLISEFEGVI